MNQSSYFWIGLGLTLVTLVFIWSCKDSKTTESTDKDETAKAVDIVKSTLPNWAKNANIYEVNLRQFTPEGTINAFEAHLPRLKEMGVDILWFMPMHPISKKNRKGTLGSYYAVQDYKAINPNYGTLDEFKNLVKKIHSMGMYVLIDWVPNHTGFDNAWTVEHPDWYQKDADGNIIHPKNTDWTDVAALDYNNKEMRKAMIDALEFWVRDMDIDGYRCDVASMVPDDFWAEVAPALHKIKNVFMLAEAEHGPHRNDEHFHMSYGWSFHHLMNSIAKGEKNVSDINAYLKADAEKFNKGFHMHFTSNHDENSWNGTVFERMGEAHKCFAVLAATMDGMLLLYSGQEAPMKKRLAFFEKDQIDWNDYAYADFYKKIFALKKKNKALWNGEFGGKLQQLKVGDGTNVFAFSREKDGDKLIAFFNLSKTEQRINIENDALAGSYNKLFSNQAFKLDKNMELTLAPWEYVVLSNK